MQEACQEEINARWQFLKTVLGKKGTVPVK